MVNLPYKTSTLIWMGSSREDLSAFPDDVKRVLGFALRQVQNGLTPIIASPIRQFGPGVYELKEQTRGESYRVVYVIKLKSGVYVLDAFQKKSKSGKALPKEIRKRIEARLAHAKADDKG